MEVPLYSEMAYDFGTFDGFPARCGLIDNGRLLLEGLSSQECAAFLQSWLYFGLLAVFYRRRFEIDSLACASQDHSTHRVVCIEPVLKGWTRKLKRKYSLLSGAEKITAFEKLSRSLEIAAKNIDEFEHCSALADQPFSAVVLSVRVLIATMILSWIKDVGEITKYRRYGTLTLDDMGDSSTTLPHKLYDIVPAPAGPCSERISTKLLEFEMRQKGWCPHQIYQICSSFDYATVYSHSLLNRKVQGQMNDMHQACDRQKCRGNHSDNMKATQHISSQCSCGLIGIVEHELLTIVRKGDIPLVSIHEAPHGCLELRLQPATVSSQYIAISHVWSHGLGNPTANALPQCQLTMLMRYLTRLPHLRKSWGAHLNYGRIEIDEAGADRIIFPETRKSSPLFWMDTFCIPLSEHQDEKTQAIEKMAAIYSRAAQTLVLDRELQGLSIGASQLGELLISLSWCSWMTRAWTLQEGSLSPMCYFQFADGALTVLPASFDGYAGGPSSWMNFFFRLWSFVKSSRIRSTRRRLLNMPFPRDGHDRTMRICYSRIMRELHMERKRHKDRHLHSRYLAMAQLSQLVDAWNHLRLRSTTKPRDLYTIFANLLDFNSAQVQKLPQTTRVQAMLGSFTHVPFSFLYNTGPRLEPNEVHKGRWVPVETRGSILAEEPNMASQKHGYELDITSEHYPDIFLLKAHILSTFVFLREPSSGKTFFVRAFREPGDKIYAEGYEGTLIALEKRDEVSRNKESLKAAALLVSRFGTVKTSGALPVGYSPAFVPRSALLENSDAKCISATTVFDCPLRVWQLDDLQRIPESQKADFMDLHPDGICPTIVCYKPRIKIQLVIEKGKLKTSSTRH